ncbi:MAG: type IV pilus biogenesis/stability protein PilW [Burkholderiales bacterium]|nr:type IV pilus biogenesis/stability protein PilW [Burkholderiales bacterium]
MKRLVLYVLLGTMFGSVSAQAETKSQELARLNTEMAASYFGFGQYAIALEKLKLALAAESDYAPAYSVRGLVLSELREFDGANDSFKKALSLAPDDFDINHNYGWFLCNRVGKYKDSLHYFTQAVKNPLYTTPEKSLVMAGTCAIKANDLDAADAYLHQAERSMPNNSPVMFQSLAELAYARGEFQSARDLLEREAKVAPATAASIWLAIRVDRKLGDKPTATLENDLSTRFPQTDEARKLAKGQFD